MLTREITGEPQFTEMEGCMPDTHDESLAPRDFPCHLRLTPEFLRRQQALIQLFWSERSERCPYSICQVVERHPARGKRSIGKRKFG